MIQFATDMIGSRVEILRRTENWNRETNGTSINVTSIAKGVIRALGSSGAHAEGRFMIVVEIDESEDPEEVGFVAPFELG